MRRNDPQNPRMKIRAQTEQSPLRMQRELTADDVIAVLLDLFDHLRIGPSDLASRVIKVDPNLLAAHRLSFYTASVGQLLTAWHQNPKYLDEFGHPVGIRFHGQRRSFLKLAKDAAPNIDPAMLLMELKRVGAVSIDKSGLINVRMRSLPVYKDNRLAIQHTLVSLHSFISTLRHNLDSDPSNSDQWFHRVAWNGSLNRELIPSLKIKLKRQGQSFLESFDNWMTQKSQRPQHAKGKTRSTPVFIGVYLAIGQDTTKGYKRRSKVHV